MVIYEGPFLNISWEKDNKLFVQNWERTPRTLSEFKQEMLTYVSFYNQYRPAYTLWKQQRFELRLETSAYQWIEKYINIPFKAYGNIRCAFIVSKDVLAHLSVIDAFENVDSCIINEHFATEKEARQWLFHIEPITSSSQQATQLFFEGIDDAGRPIIKLSQETASLKNTIKSFRNTLTVSDFMQKNQSIFNELTQREREIIRYLASGLSKKQIATALHIAIGTVQTHTKNIYKKLEINKVTELAVWVENFPF